MFRTNRSNFVSNVKCLKLCNRKVVTYSQERIVDGWKAHSLIPVKRGFLRLTAVASLTRRLMVIFFSLFIKKVVHMGFVLLLSLNTNYYTYEIGYFLTI